MSPTRIAIVGAGPVGLTLARLIHNKPNIEVVIFESDKSEDARKQGGTLDLHPGSGLSALEEAGLYDEFLKRARFDGEAVIFTDKNLVKYIEQPRLDEESSNGRPEIDRYLLREMLLNSVPSEVIRWGCHLRAIDENHNLIFDHGIESGFDLVVGADGAWSKIRKLVSDEKPHYSGTGGFNFTIPNAEETAPDCYQLTNRGSLYAYWDGKAIVSQQQGDGSLNVYAFAVRPEDWYNQATFDKNDIQAIRQATLEEFSGWDSRLLDFVRHAQDAVYRSLYMLPVGWSWKHRAGMTLIGDAAHAMTPFAGQGVNLGMEDALKLSQAIIKATNSPESDLTAAIKTFEEDLFVRAKSTAELTHDMMTWFLFTEGALRTTIEKVVIRMVSSDMRPPVSWVTYPLLVAGTYAYYFFFSTVSLSVIVKWCFHVLYTSVPYRILFHR
ncbi:hypothetical protein NUU61_008508 [Penicillium alfredii]|uniref:FAD-binding domain-containing protein n=1 Tax=Penicillium alfredii TaxID=1506179 RepID=A0A9W9ELI3_9EURO|nr:uncharacterized protein NUU61_008508 [Penicillium alfredii]KAJ5083929.1 hypothetical protein NUU61_008508 [Penicillium alfredii]